MDLLIENFEVLADAPNGVQKLRELILQLAVQGKLTSDWRRSHPELVEGSHSASALLDKIKAEKENLISKGKIKAGKLLPQISKDEKPYDLPQGWKWTRLLTIGQTQTGTTPSKNNPAYFGNEYPFIKPADINERFINYFNEGLSESGLNIGRKIKAGSVLMVCIGGSIGKANYIDRDCSCNQQINTITPYSVIPCRFVNYILRSPYFQNEVLSRAPQTTLPILSKGKWEQIPFPLPPFEEQKRIAAKVDQLMALCNELEKQKERRAKKRVSINKAAINKLLESKEQSAFNTNWQRIQNNFDLLYDVPENVAQLKQAILQLAVQGKLVPQNPNDKPAIELLKRIKAEKEKLITEGKIKAGEPLTPIREDEKPYDLPQGWEWVKLKELSLNIHYGFTASANPLIKDYRLLRITDIQKDKVNWDYVPGCEISSDNAKKYLLNENDILIARTGGTIGKSYIVKNINVKAVFASYLIRIIPAKSIFPNYIKLFLGSFLYWEQLYANSMGTGQPNVNGVALSNLKFSLPSFDEQKRIVAKVDSLMQLCDGLEAKLSKSQRKAERLMNAVVQGVI